MPPPSTLTAISKLLTSFTASSGWRTIMRPVSRPKNSSSERSFTVIRPLPGRRYTRAVAVLRRPVPYWICCVTGMGYGSYGFRPLELKRLRLLRTVWVLAAGEHMKLPVHAPAQRVLRQHALHCEFDHPLRVLAQELLEGDRLDAADVAGVVVIDLVGELAPGDTDLVRVHHDDMVAHVHVRAVIGLVLALQAVRDLRGKPSQGLVACIDDEPVAADTAGLGKYGLHKLRGSKEGVPEPKKARKCTATASEIGRAHV